MDHDDAILAELRKISAAADLQRKVTKWSFITMAIVIPAMIIFGVVMETRFNASFEETISPEKAEPPTWTDVDWRTRRGDLEEAIKMGEQLIQKTPQYPDGHRRLALAYLAAGKIEQARTHFAQAFHLFPSEENRKLLIAINTRIREATSQTNAEAGVTQPPGSGPASGR